LASQAKANRGANKAPRKGIERGATCLKPQRKEWKSEKKTSKEKSPNSNGLISTGQAPIDHCGQGTSKMKDL